MEKVIKRDGRIVDYDPFKITNAIWAAVKAVGGTDYNRAVELTQIIQDRLNVKYEDIATVEQIQDEVEKTLVKAGHYKTAKAYILYRKQHQDIRNAQALVSMNNDVIEKYISQNDWRVNENANMTFSLQGMNFHISGRLVEDYWLHRLYPDPVRQCHESGDFHIHDTSVLGPYCVGWDLMDLLTTGFRGVKGKVASKPPKHFRAALGQAVNFMFTLQGECAGAQAFASFDTLLAPFIYYDGLNYEQVKQSLQEFIFNMNVPTRVGFQCLSEDTEILSRNGWVNYDKLKTGDEIATYNINSQSIEYMPVKKVFARKYEGKMYHLKNRITDQLISPNHRIVRRKYHANPLLRKVVLEPIEQALSAKSPISIPVANNGNINGIHDLDLNMVKLAAWIISDGTIDKSGRGTGRISIYQSKIKHPVEYDEIITLCDDLGLSYTEREQNGLGGPVAVIRFLSESNKEILAFFESDKEKGIKHIPPKILQADANISRAFIATYLKGDGTGNKTLTVCENLKNELMQVIINAGLGATDTIRDYRNNPVNKQLLHIIRIIKTENMYIEQVDEINYSGIIWCPSTDNETVVARRNGKTFITGNSPFSNLSFDLEVSPLYKDQPVIIGGEFKDKTYGEFQKEMNMLNQAFAEIMVEGDAEGRVFTFPIPTYNITEDFDWDNPQHDIIWQMTAKYGIPYFANFVNSDMNPEDARSMCCRLRLDTRELQKRGGGLFGSNPLTGSIGVVTINMPRLGYLSANKEDFFSRLALLMDIASQSLEIKRKALENLTEQGLYPYSKFYLRSIKQSSGQYWVNHFSTIGLVGMNEACLNLLDKSIADPEGQQFAIEVLNFMRERIRCCQKKTGNLYNLEATPAEGCSYSLLLKDRERFKDYPDYPYYNNSTQLPVNYTDDLFLALRHQELLQELYTGGTVLHAFLGEAPEPAAIKALLQKMVRFRIPYYSFTPTFSVCEEHGYLKGEQYICPLCNAETEVFSRVVGYLRPISQYNKGKREEAADRRKYVVGKY